MIRLDDHLTDEETAARLAEVDRLTAPLNDGFPYPPPWCALLGLLGSGLIAVLTVLAFVML